jgi:hypothetical protein
MQGLLHFVRFRVRNELVHSLNDAKIKAKSDQVREAYLAVTESESQKQGVRDMSDTEMVTSALLAERLEHAADSEIGPELIDVRRLISRVIVKAQPGAGKGEAFEVELRGYLAELCELESLGLPMASEERELSGGALRSKPPTGFCRFVGGKWW